MNNLVYELSEAARRETEKNSVHYVSIEDNLSYIAANRIVELECHVANLFNALKDMHNKHKCGCCKKGCNRCHHDDASELLLKSIWI